MSTNKSKRIKWTIPEKLSGTDLLFSNLRDIIEVELIGNDDIDHLVIVMKAWTYSTYKAGLVLTARWPYSLVQYDKVRRTYNSTL
jgi:hypothetical protein